MTDTPTRIPLTLARNSLERDAARWLNKRAPDYRDGVAGVARDLFKGGCSGGMVNHLIHYRDTERYAKRHLLPILDALEEYREEMGERVAPPNGEWTANDLAWVGFELAARRVCSAANIEC
jgi:hypothetical protein